MSSETDVQCSPGIAKKIINPGINVPPDYPQGSKLTFHFQTSRVKEDDETLAVIDDSKKVGRPMELILGKQFKMPVWEECIKSMRENEVAEFTVKKYLVDSYPLVSKSYREFAGVAKSTKNSCCGGMLAFAEGGFGHDDLVDLMRNPSDLMFKMELVGVQRPGEYEPESWSMDPEEKLQSVSLLKEAGNRLYAEQRYQDAAAKYGEALGRIEQLLLREKPGEEEWLALEKIKIPILLNYSQCKLIGREYYPVIEHTTAVLDKDPDNTKALFRRAKAYAATWDFELAQRDFEKVAQLDPSIQAAVRKEMKLMSEARKTGDADMRAKLRGKIF